MKDQNVSSYCTECVEKIKKKCAGKSSNVATTTFFGTVRQQRLHGVKFCSQYSFADSCYTFPNNEPYRDTIQKAKQRGNKKHLVETAKETASHVDAAQQLSSNDFDDLIGDVDYDDETLNDSDEIESSAADTDDQLSSLDIDTDEFLI